MTDDYTGFVSVFPHPSSVCGRFSMSKPYPGSAPPHLDPEEQIRYYVGRVRDRVHPSALARLRARVQELGLEFSEDEEFIIAALDNPRRVQWFLDEEIYYNNDHASIEQDETSMSPRSVLQTGKAHCFEGALFAYAVNYLHGFAPRWMLLEGSKDVDHNLIVYQDKHAVRWGCNAHSGYPHLNGRSAEFATLRGLAESYHPYYYSGYTNDPKDLTLVGYSEPFDLTPRFGVKWMASLEPTWDLYYTLVDASIKFHRMFTDSTETHEYPLIMSLRNRWIDRRAGGAPFVNVNRLPPRAQEIWHQFWETFEPAGFLPRGKALELEQEFFKLTGTTPIDLNFNLEEFGYFLEKGYKPEQLFRKKP